MEPVTYEPYSNSQLSQVDAHLFRRMARWARFIGVVGLVGTGIMVLMALLANMLAATMQRQVEQSGVFAPFDMSLLGTLYTILFMLVAALYFVPSLLLFQFGNRTLKALSNGFEPAGFTSAINAHRRLYKFMGILTMIVLGFYGIILLFSLLGVAAGGWMMGR